MQYPDKAGDWLLDFPIINLVSDRRIHVYQDTEKYLTRNINVDHKSRDRHYGRTKMWNFFSEIPKFRTPNNVVAFYAKLFQRKKNQSLVKVFWQNKYALWAQAGYLDSSKQKYSSFASRVFHCLKMSSSWSDPSLWPVLFLWPVLVLWPVLTPSFVTSPSFIPVFNVCFADVCPLNL